ISFDRKAWQGCYLMRMQPGAAVIEHSHPGMEEFVILEGELIDSDGTVFKTGDFVSYEAGTVHHSRTETGCLIAVFEWRRPQPSPPAAQVGSLSRTTPLSPRPHAASAEL